MKIYLSKPRYHWLSPYTICEKVCFWREIDYDEPWVERTNKILEPVMVAIRKFLDFVHPEINYVKIDYWDTWSMDHTLSPIILPMLKQLKATKHGSQMVDLEDVPEHMRSYTTEDYDGQTTFEFYAENIPEGHDVHSRWEWVLDEMIFAFEHLVDDSWENKYYSGKHDWYSEPCKWDENGNVKMYEMKDGPNHTFKCDYEGLRKEWDRVENGLRLFGKYFRGLWD